jgi:hypothetical protein
MYVLHVQFHTFLSLCEAFGVTSRVFDELGCAASEKEGCGTLSQLLGRCSRYWRKRCKDAIMVYSQAERVFILEYCFSSKLSAAVLKAFSKSYRTEW